MNTEPYGTTLFCDDIRHETRGKLTLIGCYSSELNFSAPQPGLLPTFAALVNIRIPRAVKFNSIKVSVLKEEGADITKIVETAIDVPESSNNGVSEDITSGEINDIVTYITLPLQWSPLSFKEPGFIKVRAYLDGDREIRLGALKINFPNSVSENTASETG